MQLSDLPFAVTPRLKLDVWTVAVRRKHSAAGQLYRSENWGAKHNLWPTVEVRGPQCVEDAFGNQITYRDGSWWSGDEFRRSACAAAYWWTTDPDASYPAILALRDAKPVTRRLTDAEARCIVEAFAAECGGAEL